MTLMYMVLDTNINGISHTSQFASVGGKKSKIARKSKKTKTAGKKKAKKVAKKTLKKQAKKASSKTCLLCKRKKCKGLFCFL